MEEADSVARALGVDLEIGIDQRLAGAEKVGAHKTSMLQDVETCRPLEVEAVLGTVVEIGTLLGLDLPTLRTHLRVYQPASRSDVAALLLSRQPASGVGVPSQAARRERQRCAVLAMVLAGGEGKRLFPLRPIEPAVPFGGNYRLIDFALSNLVNAGFFKIVVLTQYKSHSLDRHIAQTWRLSTMLNNYVASVPAQMRRGPRWFAGSADAIFQNLNLIHDEGPDYILVFGADHIYRMDPRQMLEHHIASGAGLTVAALRVPRAESEAFGVIEADPSGRIRAFHEKPTDPVGLPDAPDEVLASMGNYVFTTRTLLDAVTADAADETSVHDLGGSIVPNMVARGDAAAYDFATNEVPGASDADRGYWRDVGELDAYYVAHMDLISPVPAFNLYNHDWPIYSWQPPLPPAKLVVDGLPGQALDSLLSAGVIVVGGTVRRSVLSPEVRIERGALVEGSVLLDGVRIGTGAVVRNAILDKNVEVAPASGSASTQPPTAPASPSPAGVVVSGRRDRVESQSVILSLSAARSAGYPAACGTWRPSAERCGSPGPSGAPGCRCRSAACLLWRSLPS